MGNFRVEPPGLFRGRGDHPKMGKLKARIYPRDITINIGESGNQMCTSAPFTLLVPSKQPMHSAKPA